MKHNEDELLHGFDNSRTDEFVEDILDFVREKNPITIDLRNGVSNNYIKQLNLEDQDVVGIKLNLLYEFLFSIGLLKTGNKNLHTVKQSFLENGYIIENIVAAYPNLIKPRYILPFYDKNSHRFLFRNLFLPRRYSLTIMNRIALNIYCWLLVVIPNPSTIHQYCFLLVSKK